MHKLFLFILISLLSFSIFTAEIVLTDGNHIVLDSAITMESVAKAQMDLFKAASLTPVDKPLYIFLDSPGGSLTAGRLFIDTVKGIPNKVHTITFFSASMAYIISQYLDTRYILESGTLMSHRVKLTGLSGQVPGELVSKLNLVKQEIAEISNFISRRIGVHYRFYNKWIRDELWLSGKSAVFFNHMDELATVTCDKSLMGSRIVKVKVLVFDVNVEFSMCPLIRGPLSIKIMSKKKVSPKIEKIILKEIHRTINNKNKHLQLSY